ncbi:hypothetical protein HYT33_02625 [Candidatus Roizmanbacteria bacterium]|nr:hypothetical protein [Candidatus Roizmanbacteria bacterium]
MVKEQVSPRVRDSLGRVRIPPDLSLYEVVQHIARAYGIDQKRVWFVLDGLSDFLTRNRPPFPDEDLPGRRSTKTYRDLFQRQLLKEGMSQASAARLIRDVVDDTALTMYPIRSGFGLYERRKELFGRLSQIPDRPNNAPLRHSR